MRVFNIVCVLLLSGALEACSSDDAPPTPTHSTLAFTSSPSQDLVAHSALERLRRFASKGKGSNLGFSAPQELEGASIGLGIPLYSVDSTRLASFSPEMDPHTVLVEQRQIFYPVMAKSASGGGGMRAASSVLVTARADGAWVITEIGRRNLAHAVEHIEKEILARQSPTTFALVEVPSPHLRLLGYEEGGKFWLTPLGSVSGTSLVEGEPKEAALALRELAALHKTM